MRFHLLTTALALCLPASALAQAPSPSSDDTRDLDKLGLQASAG